MRRLLLCRMKLSSHESCGVEDTGALDSDYSTREGGSESRSRWYLVQCRAHQDKRALEHLQRQRFECYRPLYEKECVRRGDRCFEIAALFPGYIFIRLNRSWDNWAPIRSTRGVIQIVRFNDVPLPVADGIVEQIRRRIEDRPIREPYLKSGDSVIVTKGSFSGIEGIFVASAGDERVMLLLNVLQSDHTLSFPIESVRKVDGKACMG